MTPITEKIDVYLEVGKKRMFAGAIDWPGWARSGRDEASALQALCDNGARYEHILRETQLGFQAPSDVSAFNVVERLEGNATTDFGAPDIATSSDQQPVNEAELQRFQALLQACWRAFDATVRAAAGKELRKGPRGGGRELEKIVEHVVGAESGYLSRIGYRLKIEAQAEDAEKIHLAQKGIMDALPASAQGRVPEKGPRGGTRWAARYYVRRSAWHILDHVWEIEDRIID